MSDVKEISLLPVNSYELESHLTTLGLSLVQFGREYGFSEKYTGVRDCDFLQSAVIEFTSEIKPDLIAYLGIYAIKCIPGTRLIIRAEELPKKVKIEAAKNAREKGFVIINRELRRIACLSAEVAAVHERFKVSLFRMKNFFKSLRISKPVISGLRDGKIRILMTSYHSNTVSTLTPIQNYLRTRDDVHHLYIANRYETFQNLVGRGYQYIINGWTIDAGHRPHQKSHVLSDFLELYFEKYFPHGQATHLFRSRFLVLLQKKLDFLLSLYGPMRRVIEEFQPHVLVLSSCSTADAQLLIHLCGARHVKVVEMTHGMFHDTPILKFQNVPIKLVWNQHQFDLMKKYRPEITCKIIGNPKHDELIRKFSQSSPKKHFRTPYILFASTPGNNISISLVTYVSILKDFVELARRYPDMPFVFKLHPSEDVESVRRLADKISAPENFVVVKDADVYELMYHAEIVMVVTSTVGYEALLFDKKIICYEIANSEKWMPLANFGLAKKASDADSLGKALDEWLKEDVSIDKARKSYFVFTDGNAINNTIISILE